MVVRRAVFGSALALLLLAPAGPAAAAGASAAAQSQSFEDVFLEDASGNFVHRASGFAFPPALAALDAVAERVFAPDNVMIRYGATGPEDGGPWLDLFIYPAEGGLGDEAAEVGEIIVSNYSATAVANPRALPPAAADGRQGWYSAELAGVQARTGFVLVRRAGWSMKVRTTVPDRSGAAGLAAVLDAIAAIQWDWLPDRSPQPEGPSVAAR